MGRLLVSSGAALLGAALIVGAFLLLGPARSYALRIAPRDLQLLFAVVLPFTLAGSFLVIWPSYSIQRRQHREWIRAMIVILVGGVAGVLMLMPFGIRLPWLGLAGGIGTSAVWLAMNRALTTRKRH